MLESLERRELLAGDLVAHWHAADLADQLAPESRVLEWVDRIGQSSVNASFGTATFQPGGLNRRDALRFDSSDGVDQLVANPDENPISDKTDFSVTVVFATSSTALAGGEAEWFKNSGLVDSGTLGLFPDWGLSINQAGRLSSGMGAGFSTPPQTLYSSATGLNDGQVHTVTVARSGSTMAIYLDDQAADSRNNFDAGPRAKLELSIGSLLSRREGFAGDIAEVRIFDGQLSAAEVSQLHAELNTYYNNQPPTAVPDAYVVVEDGALLVGAANGVLKNDLDPENDPLRASILTPPAHGTLSMQSNGSFAYQPAADFFGTDTFTYQVADLPTGGSVGTVTIEVTPRHDPAIGNPDSYRGVPSTPLVVPAIVGVLSNDITKDGTTLIAELERDVERGQLTLHPDGSFEYDAQGQAGQTTFRYRVYDGVAYSAPVQVNLLLNTQPTAISDRYSTPEDQALVVNAAAGILSNDVDPDGDVLQAVVDTPPEHGELQLASDGSFTYRPAADYAGSDRFTYTMSDGIDTTAPVVVELTVLAVNDAPDALPDGYFTLPDQLMTVGAANGLLTNDTDRDSVVTSVRLVAAPQNGQVTLRADGSFDYQPQAGFVGQDSFTYRASDGLAESADTQVTISVSSQPVIISELMASNAETLTTRVRVSSDAAFEGEIYSPDWLELRNLLNAPVNLGGMYLTNDARLPQQWQFPEGTQIPAQGYLLVFASGLNVTDPNLDSNQALHTNFQLSTDGEYLALLNTDGSLITGYTDGYPEQRTHVSYGVPDNDLAAFAYFVQPTPGQPNSAPLGGLVADTKFSVDRGMFDAPFELTISTDTADAEIRYTTDGTPPRADYGQVYSGPITIGSTTTLRAAAFKPGLVPSNTDTHTYFFLQDVVLQDQQQALDKGFPTTWRGNRADYGLDAENQLPLIAGDRNMTVQQARDVIVDSLKSLPSLSIVMNVDDMFGATQGIYANPTSSGENWERSTSVEYIQPDGSDGFQIDAGIRIQGGAFRGFGLTPKKSLRLLFKTKYGPSKLNYPLFGEGAVTEFDTLTLRMESNDGWQWGDAGGQPQYARDEFLRRTQLAMGQPASHGTGVHVYINGQYWGLYNMVERPDESFGEAYFGSDQYDWDGINSGDATNSDGDAFRSRRTRAAWSTMQNMARDVSRATTQEEKTTLMLKLQGLDANGNRDPSQEVMLDMHNMIDYLIVNYYAHNSDWPFKNFYVGRENSPDSTGFKFFTWDAEWSLLLRSSVTGNNITDNRGVAIPFQYLRTSDEFRVMFGDRVQQHFFNGGALYVDPANPNWDPDHPERNVPAARYVEWTDQIHSALIAESARWGDQHRSTPYTRDVEWQREFDRIMTTWFPRRSETMIRQFQTLGLFPNTAAARFNQRGGDVPTGFAVELSAANGTIYYTVDGSDPRTIGGGISPQAIRYTGPVTLNDHATLKTRVLNGNEWSAIDEASFRVGLTSADANNLRVSEVHYHPADPSENELIAGFGDADEFEFIELVNLSERPIDLTNVRLVRVEVAGELQGVDFDFANSQINYLAPGATVLVVENLAAFQARYGNQLPVAGEWSGQLSNRAEQITLRAGEQVLQQFTYQDAWQPTSDGEGSSLEVISLKADLLAWNESRGWRASSQIGGSPGQASVNDRVPGDSNGDGIFNSSDFVAAFLAGQYEDNIPQNSTFETGDWNGDGEFDSRDFIYVFLIGNYVATATGEDWAEKFSLRPKTADERLDVDDPLELIDAALQSWDEEDLLV